MVSEMGTAGESQGCLGVVERGNLAQERGAGFYTCSHEITR